MNVHVYSMTEVPVLSCEISKSASIQYWTMDIAGRYQAPYSGGLV